MRWFGVFDLYLFSNVLIKFFTESDSHENNRATNNRRFPMLKDVKATLHRSADTLIEDAIGTCALFVMLFAGLCLPGLL